MGGGADLWGLFASAFLAATLLPVSSEVVLAYLDTTDAHAGAVLLLVATTGNTLGGMTSWLVGRVLPEARLEGRPGIGRAVSRLRRWGAPALLMAWAPVVGDPLCVAAGWLRVAWPAALAFMAVGKVARYAVVMALV